MIDPHQQFISKLEDKKYLANKKDRADNTDKVVKKLDELKPDTKAKKSQQAMADFFESMRGEAGQDGKNPQYGVDYLTPEEIDAIKQELTPIKGIHYLDGIDGEPGKTPVPGVDFPLPQDGISPDPLEIAQQVLAQIEIPEPIPGQNGKDGSPDTGEQIIEKVKGKLHIKDVNGVDEVLNEAGSNFLNQAKSFVPKALASLYDVNTYGLIDGQVLKWNAATQKWIPLTPSSGGGISGTASFNETPSGTIDGSNNVFTLAHTPNQTSIPLMLYVNGARQASGGVDFTLSGATITFVTPPEAGSVIFADYYY